MSLEFSALHIILENTSPTIDDLIPISSVNEEEFEIGDTHYLITTSIIEDRYFWIYAEYGKLLPYSEKVVNVKTHAVESNPRTPTQVETSKQLFGLYDPKSKNLFLSSQKKKQILEDYFKQALSKDVTIKTFFKSADEFCDKIKTISKIKFTTKRNLFNLKSEALSIFPNPNDIFGLGITEDYTLEANFADAKLTNRFVSFLKKAVGWKNECQTESLICIGLDDKQVETIFNIDAFIQKIIIPLKKDDRGIFDPNMVCQTLIQEIEKIYE